MLRSILQVLKWSSPNQTQNSVSSFQRQWQKKIYVNLFKCLPGPFACQQDVDTCGTKKDFFQKRLAILIAHSWHNHYVLIIECRKLVCFKPASTNFSKYHKLGSISTHQLLVPIQIQVPVTRNNTYIMNKSTPSIRNTI